MLNNRPAVLIIGGAFGLLFLIISVYNTRSLNSSLMAKLVETEVLLLLLLVVRRGGASTKMCICRAR